MGPRCVSMGGPNGWWYVGRAMWGKAKCCCVPFLGTIAWLSLVDAVWARDSQRALWALLEASTAHPTWQHNGSRWKTVRQYLRHKCLLGAPGDASVLLLPRKRRAHRPNVHCRLGDWSGVSGIRVSSQNSPATRLSSLALGMGTAPRRITPLTASTTRPRMF